MEKVSIIVPIYNVEPFLDNCIKSLIMQDYTNVEIILVNDESPDDSHKICEKWVDLDSRIKYITQKNQGVSVARNNGLKVATGSWVCFVDGDDWLEKDAIKKMVNRIKDNVDVIITDYIVDTDNNSWNESFFVFNKEMDFSDKFSRLELIKNCILKTSFSNKKSITAVGVPWAKIYRKSMLDSFSITFDKTLRKMQDAIFNIEVFHKCRDILYINTSTYHYLQNNVSVTHKYNPKYYIIVSNFLNSFKKFIDKYGYQTELMPLYYARARMFAFESIKFMYVLDNTGMSLLDKRKGVKKLMQSIPKTGENLKKEMYSYLSKAHKIIYFFNKLHLYMTVYFLCHAYVIYKNSGIKLYKK